MKEEVNIALVQMDFERLDTLANCDRMVNAIERATLEHNADLVIFPELANTGYIRERDKVFGRKYYDACEYIPGRTTEVLGEAARRNATYVVAGIGQKHPEIPGMVYNSAVLIGTDGKIIGVQQKVHIPGEEKHYFMPGKHMEVFTTDIGNIAMSICYDVQFPEMIRIMALKGAEILCMIWNMPSFSNPPELLHYFTAVRAAENRMFAASCNRIGSEDGVDFVGHSVISDPVGNLLATATGNEIIISAKISSKQLLEERALQPVFRDRCPELYGPIIE